MSNFQKLCEALGNFKKEEPYLAILKSQPREFWEQLARISGGGNIEGLSQLLHVSTNQIRKWQGLIKLALDELDDKQTETKKQVMLPTGKIR